MVLVRRLVPPLVLALLLAAPGARADKDSRYADIHTHLHGALSAPGLYRLAIKHDVLYPVSYIERDLGLDVPDSLEVPSPKGNLVPLGQLHKQLAPHQVARIVRSFALAPGSSFDDLEVVYSRRRVISSVERLVPDLLLEIGRESALRGVNYMELSSSTLIKRGTPDELAELTRLVNEVERQTGLRMRFLHGLPRQRPAEENVAVIRKLAQAGFLSAGSPFVGLDIQGMEDTAIIHQKPVFDEVKVVKRTNPGFILRVHAGETPARFAPPGERHLFKKNVLHAILMGADRIGHGLYGIDRRTIAEAKKRHVIFEVNPRSNEVLGFAPTRHPLPRLLRAGVGVVVSTDGAGIFRTTVPAEIDHLSRALNLSPENRSELKKASRTYLMPLRPKR